MTTRPMLFSTLRTLKWFDLVGLITQLLVTGMIGLAYPAEDVRRWWALGVMVLFMAAQYYLFTQYTAGKVRDRALPFYLLGFTLLVLALVYLEANLNGLAVLFFVLSGEALSFFPNWRGYLWVGVWGALLTGVLIFAISNPLSGLLVGLGSTCGMIFMGSAALAQRRAEEASAESQRLFGELQAAHHQLRDSATRAEELAVAQERNRVAREMHDTLGHRLTVAAVQLEGAQRLIPRNPDKAAQMVGTVRQQVLDGLQELRQTVAALRAPLEADLTLTTALERLVQQFQSATTVAVHLELPPQLPALSPEQRHALYRAVQEGLTNVQRHAQASQVRVQITPSAMTNGHQPAPSLRLVIEDNGNGYAAEQPRLGFGLHGIRERAEQLAGHMTITQGTQGGMCLVVELPVGQ